MRAVCITAPAGPVRGLLRPRPWAGPWPSVGRSVPVRGGFRLGSWTARTPKPGTHGRIADGGGPQTRLEARPRWSAGVTGAGGACCKTVGSAYVGSNPTPATTCRNGPLARNSRLCGPFLLCPVVCHLVALRGGVSRYPRTYSGRDSCLITVGAHRRLFHGRPRTGRAGGMFRLYARRSAGSWHLGDRDDGVPGLGNAELDVCSPHPAVFAPSPRQTEPGCPVGGSAGTCTPSVGTGARPRSR